MLTASPLSLSLSELQEEARGRKQQTGKRKRKREEDESSEEDEEDPREDPSGEESTDGKLVFFTPPFVLDILLSSKPLNSITGCAVV